MSNYLLGELNKRYARKAKEIDDKYMPRMREIGQSYQNKIDAILNKEESLWPIHGLKGASVIVALEAQKIRDEMRSDPELFNLNIAHIAEKSALGEQTQKMRKDIISGKLLSI